MGMNAADAFNGSLCLRKRYFKVSEPRHPYSTRSLDNEEARIIKFGLGVLPSHFREYDMERSLLFQIWP